MVDENIELIKREPKKAIRKLSIPIYITLIMGFLNSLIDTVWVAGLGPNALSAIAFITPLYLLLHAILLGGILSIPPALIFQLYLKPILIFIGARMF